MLLPNGALGQAADASRSLSPGRALICWLMSRGSSLGCSFRVSKAVQLRSCDAPRARHAARAARCSGAAAELQPGCCGVQRASHGLCLQSEAQTTVSGISPSPYVA